MKKIILFPHPGGEHGRQSKITTSKISDNIGTEYIRWHNGQHARKFLKNEGNFIDKKGNLVENKDIAFWCEWEPQSEIINNFNLSNIEKQKKELPLFLQTPFFDTTERIQNTDPFIFGNNFYWAFCRQGSQPRLTKLSSGDLVLFGSKINNKFVIDTVFVIREGIDYSWNTYNLGTSGVSNIIKKCPEYDEITLKAGSCSSSNPDYYYNYRLYVGVNYNERDSHNEMFSFFPTKQYDTIKGFKRPEIDLSDYFNYDDIKINPQSARRLTVEDNKLKRIWQEVKKQVVEQDLNLGVYTKIPPKIVVSYKNKLFKPKAKYPQINNLDAGVNKIVIKIVFKSNKQYGALIGNQNRDLNPNEFNPVIYIDTTGYLRATLWDGKNNRTLKSEVRVDDNKSHGVIYIADTVKNEQLIYLDTKEIIHDILNPDKCNTYKKDGELKDAYKISNENLDNKYFWQLGTAYTRNKPKTNGFWFVFDGVIMEVLIKTNKNAKHFEYNIK